MSFGPNQLNATVAQLDDKFAELETAITAVSGQAQARVSRDLKRAWESVYYALGYPNPGGTSAASGSGRRHCPPFAPNANVPREPSSTLREYPQINTGVVLTNAVAENTKCDSCSENATDILWVCITCKDLHRQCNKCKEEATTTPEESGGSEQHRMVAWPIRKRSISDNQYVVCDHCKKAVVGVRWQCQECETPYDMCSNCRIKVGHQHRLSPKYSIETNWHPLNTVAYTCNLCSGIIDPSALCCLQCIDFHICNSCASKGKMCKGHDYALLGVPPYSPDDASGNAKKPDDVSKNPPAQQQQLFAAVCDECNTSVNGIRHKCTRCKDYDLCEKCYRNVTTVHPGHGFIHFGGGANTAANRPPRQPCQNTTIISSHHYTCNAPTRRGCGFNRSHGGPCCVRRSGLSVHAGMNVCRLGASPPVGRPSAPVPDNTNNRPAAEVHPHVFCDGCRGAIHGARFKCGNCLDYDLCEECEGTADHNKEHLFIKIPKSRTISNKKPMLAMVYPEAVRPIQPQAATAVNVPPAVNSPLTCSLPPSLPPPPAMVPTSTPEVVETKDYVAVFVEDVTIPDGMQISPGESFVKIWCVANLGTSEWPKGTMLVHMEGEPLIPGNSKAAPVVIGKRYEQVGVAVDLVAPQNPGEYKSKWRLMTPNGQYFGSSLWCTISVIPSSSSSTTGSAKEVSSVQASTSTNAVGTSDALVDAVPASRTASIVSSPSSTSVPVAADPSSNITSSVGSKSSASINSNADSIESISNTFVKIGADLMNEIRRLEQSIKVQVRQEVADLHNQTRAAENNDSTTFDITKAPTEVSTNGSIKAYPSPGHYSDVDLLSSPPINDQHSETSSMREFYSSAARLENLLNNSRSQQQPQPQQRQSVLREEDEEPSGEEYEFVEDFPESPKQI